MAMRFPEDKHQARKKEQQNDGILLQKINMATRKVSGRDFAANFTSIVNNLKGFTRSN